MTDFEPVWRVQFPCAPDQQERVEAAFEEEALAITALLNKENERLVMEILWPEEPDSVSFLARLCQSGCVLEAETQVQIERMGDLDWIKEVSQNFEPLEIGRWTVFGAAFRDQVTSPMGLQIDATSAFGTGEHPTTRGCMLRLDRLISEKELPAQPNMLDMGCGSGILAMAFAKATAGKALGVDMDTRSIDIARQTVRANGLLDHVTIIHGCGYAPQLVTERAPYNLIMANVFADPLCEMAPDLARSLAPDGWAILSGLLSYQADNVIMAHRQQGLTLVDRMELGEWSVLALRHDQGASCAHDSNQSCAR